MRKKLILISILMFGFVASASAQTATFSNFQPADNSNYTQGDTINISVDATVSNGGTSVDIEGIFDGSIDTVFTHPGDGSTQSYTFQVTPSTGSYNYRFSAITSSPSGTFINDTESRTLNVEAASTGSFTTIDGFEDATLDGWSCDADTSSCDASEWNVENDIAFSGTYSMRQDYSGDNNQGWERTVETNSTTGFAFAWRASRIADDGLLTTLRDSNGDTIVRQELGGTFNDDLDLVRMYFPDGSGGTQTVDLAENQLNGDIWYRTVFEYDPDADEYTISIEDASGNVIDSAVQASPTGMNDINKIRISSDQDQGSATNYWDEFQIKGTQTVGINSFSPPDETNITEGETQTIEANITVENGGTPVDIEGIFDGNIDTVFSHPGDGSSQVYSFDVTPSSSGDYNYWFNVITDSPNGDSLGSTEVRSLNVEAFSPTATFSNFSPADNSTVYTGNDQDISVDVTADNQGNQIDIEAIYNGSIDQVFTHPGDGSTQSYTFTVNPSTEGTPDYRFSAITSSPGGTFINDTESRNLFVTDYPATANFTNFSPPDGSNITEGESETISIDISVDNNGNPVDVEGIFDGSIQSVNSHPGDGTTQSYSFTVTPSSAGNFTYRFSVITDSPSGTFIDDSTIRTLEVLSSDTDGGTDGGTGDNIGGMIGGTIAEILAGIVDGFFSGVESQVSESNQAFLAIIVSVILGMIAGAFTGHGSFGVGTTVLSVLGFTIKGWLPSWVGFVFVVITAGLVAWIGSKAGGG